MAFAAMWEDGLKMHAADVFAACLTKAGFDDYPDRINRAEVKNKLMELTQKERNENVRVGNYSLKVLLYTPCD
jgi:2-hydroxychromene-2-carboxylate isomerase